MTKPQFLAALLEMAYNINLKIEADVVPDGNRLVLSERAKQIVLEELEYTVKKLKKD